MESALDVLSRAATMVQDNANETRLTSKELPTTTWRRERRLRIGEYHHSHHHSSSGLSINSVRVSSPSSSPPPSAHLQYSPISSNKVSNTSTNMCPSARHISIMMAAAASMRPLNENSNHPSSTSPPPDFNIEDQIHFEQMSNSDALQPMNSIHSDEAPLDMSVANLKQRNSPPPPYREPLPGSHFASTLARPSVITQAPPKKDVKDSILVANRENDNRSCESIDEHFRRSLGNDYFSLFSKRSPTNQTTKTPSPQPSPSTARMRSPIPTLPPPTTLIKAELIPPPAYVPNSCSINHQQSPQQAHQNQSVATPKGNNVLMLPATSASQMKIAADPNSPPLPLLVRPNILQNTQHSNVLEQSTSLITITSLASPKSPVPTRGARLNNTTQTPGFNTSVSRTASPLPLQQQPSGATANFSHLASLDDSPTSSPRHTPPILNMSITNPATNSSAIMRIKIEPGLQNVKSNISTPPSSPTLATNNNINSIATSNISSPSSPKTASWKTENSNTTSTEVLASVDDHFAKALGDTWKKLQQKKEIRK